MIFDILTLFPGVCISYCQTSVLGRAIKARLIDIRVINIRNYTHGEHYVVDDFPYGGGNGMVIKAPPLIRALVDLESNPPPRILLMSPHGSVLTQDKVQSLAKWSRLVFICGHYEGIDERVRDLMVHEELSIGDFILSGGELAALCVIDAISRSLPGVLHGINSFKIDSFMDGLLEYPHYTRPFKYAGLTVPKVLLSGNHIAIARWRRKESLRRTLLQHPDLLVHVYLNQEDLRILDEICDEEVY